MNGQPEPSVGRLTVRQHGDTGERVLRVDTGERKPKNIDMTTLDASLRSRFDAGEEVEDEVWFEAPEGGNRVRLVRPVGTDLPRPPAAEPAQPIAAPPMPAHNGPFLNPYNFVPAKARSGAPETLQDETQVSHGALHPNRYSGSISLSIETATPLLLADPYRAEWANRHGTFPVAVDSEGQPVIHPTAVKGMLRSAFEAVTGSRFGVFTGHDKPHAFRKSTQSALGLEPVRLVDDGTNAERFEDAAWLPIKRNGRDVNGDLSHGSEVEVEIEGWKRGNFRYWLVIGGLESPGLDGHQRDHGRKRRRVRGRVHKMGRNFTRKHDDRLFFGKRSEHLTVPPSVLEAFAHLVFDYRDIHATDLRDGLFAPGGVNWSRQVSDDQYEVRKLTTDEYEFQDPNGITCYARMEKGEVVELVPVLVSRGLYKSSPFELLDPTLRPAASQGEMSPADRVFGWVGPDGEGGRRSQLSVGPVRCIAEAGQRSIRAFQPALPLQILSSPKPAQGRFYVGDAWDRPLDEKRNRSDVYRDGQYLRGRKLYPHHAGLESHQKKDYWSRGGSGTSVTTPHGDRFREFIRPAKLEGGEPEQDDQNRSVGGWVEPGTNFAVVLRVENISLVELGALLWLCDLNSGLAPGESKRHHRLGGGKPLGFGSVLLTVEELQLARGEEVRKSYKRLRIAGEDAPAGLKDQAVSAFKKAIEEWFNKPFGDVPSISAFVAIGVGNPDYPVHYPRTRRNGDPNSTPPHPDGKSYEWFVANERTVRTNGSYEPAEGLPLPLPGRPLPTHRRR